MWILKPGANARGVGISISCNLSEIIERSQNILYQPFIVQKYLEEPFLIDGYKFDIRQFVLVTSLNPLVIFMYGTAYLRFSSQGYSLQDLSKSVEERTQSRN